MGLQENPWMRSAASQACADRHFLHQRGYASNDSSEDDAICSEPGESFQCHFTVFRADSVSVTSTQFAGGDWRWRLSDHEGATLVEAGGYRNEAHCRKAVTMLKACAARAAVD